MHNGWVCRGSFHQSLAMIQTESMPWSQQSRCMRSRYRFEGLSRQQASLIPMCLATVLLGISSRSWHRQELVDFPQIRLSSWVTGTRKVTHSPVFWCQNQAFLFRSNGSTSNGVDFFSSYNSYLSWWRRHRHIYNKCGGRSKNLEQDSIYETTHQHLISQLACFPLGEESRQDFWEGLCLWRRCFEANPRWWTYFVQRNFHN